MCCYPLTDWMYRKQLEVIEALLKSLVYVRSDKDIATKLEQTTNFVNGKHWSKYIEFQGAYKDRLNVLRTEKREIPKEPGADRNMPPIPHTWTGNWKTSQPSKNFENDASCAFGDHRIGEYERHNNKFAESITYHGPVAAAKIIPLLILDIAYLKSFEIEWESTPPALESGAAADDDDDDDNASGEEDVPELDCSKWCATDASTVPFEDLKFPKHGQKLPPHLLVASAALRIVKDSVPDEQRTRIAEFARKLHTRVRELAGKEPDRSDLAAIMTRDFNDHEAAIWDLLHDSESKSASAAASTSPSPASSPKRTSAPPASAPPKAPARGMRFGIPSPPEPIF